MICKYLYRYIHCAPLCFYHKFTLWLCLLSKLLPFYLHKLKLASQHDCVCKDLSTCDVCLWVIHLCRAESLVFCFRDNTLFTSSRVECKLDLQRHQGQNFFFLKYYCYGVSLISYQWCVMYAWNTVFYYDLQHVHITIEIWNIKKCSV